MATVKQFPPQAQKLFSDLADSPFIAMCFVEGDLRVYTKGLDDRANRLVQILLVILEEEAHGKT